MPVVILCIFYFIHTVHFVEQTLKIDLEVLYVLISNNFYFYKKRSDLCPRQIVLFVHCAVARGIRRIFYTTFARPSPGFFLYFFQPFTLSRFF